MEMEIYTTLFPGGMWQDELNFYYIFLRGVDTNAGVHPEILNLHRLITT